MADIDIDKLTPAELAALGNRVTERRAALAAEKDRIQAEDFDIARIRVGMSSADTTAAVKAICRALEGK